MKKYNGYETVEEKEIADLNSKGTILKHKKTGARVILIENDDENKVFYIGFRTPPVDSTGSAHIVEHTVLCGSKNFPVKDPFIELAKGSLNTFLNAMTYPDKTVYPVASCNDKDFQNLMHVYLDAVFYPNIYREEKIFKQEGWHYEMENADDELTLNGVVYNEMKGAFSSSDDVLEREISNTLFPDTSYGFESGGDPEVIPELTYEKFLDFHRRYYHPSNSYIYLYGNMDMAEKLEFLDREYLDSFDRQTVESEIKLQKPFTETKEVQKSYSVSEGEAEENNTYLSVSKVVGSVLDRELYIAFQILDYALCSAPGAPLKQAMIEAGIGTDVYSIFDEGVRQPYFSVIAKNANVQQKEEFLDTYRRELEKLAKEGIDKKSLYAGLNHFEFKHREADFGSYPKGLMYGLQMLDSWLYDEEKPFIHVEANETYAALRKKIEEGYFEKLIEDCLLDNKHSAVVVLVPEKGLTAKRDRELADKLQAYKETLSEEEIKHIVEETKALKAYQEEGDTPEALACIPHLTREDIKKEAEGYVNELHREADVPVLHHDVFTNGIGYLRLSFDCGRVPEELFPYLGLLKAMLGLIDTESYSYGELFHEINIETGGMAFLTNTYTKADLSGYSVRFELKAKALFEKLPEVFRLAVIMMKETKWTDYKRLKELLEEIKSRMQSAMLEAGHTVSALRALSYISSAAASNEQITGVTQYRLVADLVAHFEERKEELAANMNRLVRILFRQENLLVDYTASKEGYEKLPELVAQFKEKLYTGECDAAKEKYRPVPEKKNEGFLTASQVQYVCRAGNFIEKGLSYTGALKVLRVMMSYDYLWNNVRVKGGAYGCMCSFGKSGESYFVSYRDPNLEKTVAVYEAAADYIENWQGDEEELTQYLIGAISELDTPKTPQEKGTFSLGGYLTGLSEEKLQQERDEILSVNVETIRSLAKHIRAFMSDDCLCVLGREDKIKQADGFGRKEQLFS
ncbi:MAG: insulinase family protein [Lachnospiraceae bacterium]|nr:insulinase family protein [Lachnospiraceae bacterium]